MPASGRHPDGVAGPPDGFGITIRHRMSAQRHLLAPQKRNAAQVACGVLGIALIVIGIIGLAIDASWETGNAVSGDAVLGVEFTGWHGMVHIATGLLLLVGLGDNTRARHVARFFGFVYLVVAIAGWIDGDDVFHLIPANTADNILHTGLALMLIGAAMMSKDRRDQIGRDRASVDEDEDPTRVVGPGSGHVGGPRAIQPRIDRRLPQKQHP